MRKLLLTSVILASAVTGATTSAMAQSAEDVVKARRAFYTLVGYEMSTLGAIAKGDIDYDAATATQTAKDLMTLVSLNTGDYFAPGTSMDDLPGETRAKAAIWSDMDGVKEKGMAFYQAIVELNEVAGDGLDALRPAVGKLGGTCKDCHSEFRAKDF